MIPYFRVIALAAVVAAFLFGEFHGRHTKDVEWTARVEKERADFSEQARKTEQMWQGVVNETAKNYDAKIGGIRRNLDIALDGLRDRPERSANLPETPRTECQGSTGAELSGQDAEFLAREAARADQFRAGLEACYQVIDAAQ